MQCQFNFQNLHCAINVYPPCTPPNGQHGAQYMVCLFSSQNLWYAQDQICACKAQGLAQECVYNFLGLLFQIPSSPWSPESFSVPGACLYGLPNRKLGCCLFVFFTWLRCTLQQLYLCPQGQLFKICQKNPQVTQQEKNVGIEL